MTRIALLIPVFALFAAMGGGTTASSLASGWSKSSWSVHGYVDCRDGEAVFRGQLGPFRGQLPGGAVLQSECRYPTR